MALAAVGALALGASAQAANIGVTPTKLIIVDKLAAAGKAKAVFVAKDPAVDKGGDTDVSTISVDLSIKYDNGTENISGSFNVPAGASNGTEGWLVNKSTVAKYVNKGAPAGSTVTKVSVIKQNNLVKLVGKDRGDTPLDILNAGSAPSGTASTAYCLTNGATSNCFCSTLPCVWKSIAGNTGAKLVCKGGSPDGACSAAAPPPSGTVLKFTTGPAGGTCGVAKAGGSGGAVVKNLSCGGLNIGHGSGTVPEGPTPAGADTFFNTACAAGTCTVTARTAAQTGSNRNCSDTGCDFGPFLPIANPGTPALSTCVHNTFDTPGGGSLNTSSGSFTGSVPLSSQTTVTGNVTDPCPKCVAGSCDAGWTAAGGVPSPDAGNACTDVSGSGDTYDCRPPQAPYSGVLAPFPVTLSPIGTGQSTLSGATPCPGQSTNGCFGQPTCDYIEENGAAGGTLSAGAHSATLASAFCIPATGNVLVDGSAGLPGPGATSLPGTLTLLP